MKKKSALKPVAYRPPWACNHSRSIAMTADIASITLKPITADTGVGPALPIASL